MVLCLLCYSFYLCSLIWKEEKTCNYKSSNCIFICCLFFSNPEYKDTPMDIAQLPHLPEKTSESSETSDSESDSKDNSGKAHDVSFFTLTKDPWHESHMVAFPTVCQYFSRSVLLQQQKSCRIKLKKSRTIF